MRNLIHTSFIHFLRPLRLAEHCQRETSFIPHSYIPCAHCASQNTVNEKPHSYLIHTSFISHSYISCAHCASQNTTNEKLHPYLIHTFLALITLRRTLPTRNFIHNSFIHVLHSFNFAERCQREISFIPHSYISCTYCTLQNAATRNIPHIYSFMH